MSVTGVAFRPKNLGQVFSLLHFSLSHSTHFAECDSMVRQVTNSIFQTNQFYTKGNLLLIPKEEFSPFHTEKISPWETSSDFTALSMYIGNGVSVIFKKLGRQNLSATYPGPVKTWAVVLPHSTTESIAAVFPKVVSSYQNNSVEGWKKIKRKVPINMESVQRTTIKGHPFKYTNEIGSTKEDSQLSLRRRNQKEKENIVVDMSKMPPEKTNCNGLIRGKWQSSLSRVGR